MSFSQTPKPDVNAQFSRLTKNKRLFEKKISYLILFFFKWKNFDQIIAFFIQLFDPQSIDALNEVLQNFLKFRQFFQSFFFASLKSVIDLPKYRPLA